MIKLIRVNNLGPLVAFDNENSLFNYKKCVIHGLNGSGKSQICGLLRHISQLRSDKVDDKVSNDIIEFARNRISKEATEQAILVQIDQCNIGIELTTGKIKVTGSLPQLHIFNEEYLAANISSTVNLPEKPIRIGETNQERNLLETNLKKTKESLASINKSINEQVEKVRANTGYGGQKRTAEIISRENYLADTNPTASYPNARSELENLSDPPERIIIKSQYVKPDAHVELAEDQDIDYLLSQSFVKPSLTQAIYQQYVHAHKQFYSEGTKLFRKIGNHCPFCLASKTETDDTIEELLSYIESEYSLAENTLSHVRKSIQELCNDLNTFIERSNTENILIRNVIEKLGLNISLSDIVNVSDKLEIISNIVSQKLEDMENSHWESNMSFSQAIEECLKPMITAYEDKENLVNEVNKTIDHLSKRRRQLGEMIIKNEMHDFWEKRELRDRRMELIREKIEIEKRLNEIAQIPSNDRTVGFFNQILRFLGIRKYELSVDSRLMLCLDTDHDITNEGFRISTGERKLLGLSYFLAEVLSSVATRQELSEVTIVIDDPVDSSDYDRFYSFLAVIEKLNEIICAIYGHDDIEIGQFLIFTHNALLYERLANSKGFSGFLLGLKGNQTSINTAKKGSGLTTFSSYMKRVCYFIKRMEPPKTVDLGNSIRRILEIVASVENITNNNIRELTGTSKLNALANHLSHDSLERMLDPLPDSHEYLAASIELVELIKKRIPYLYETIEEHYLGGKTIQDFRDDYENKYLA